MDQVRASAEDGGYEMFELNGKPVAGLAPKMDPGQPTFWTSYIAVADAGSHRGEDHGEGWLAALRPDAGARLRNDGGLLGAGRLDGSVWQAGTHEGSGLANEPGAFTWNELNTRDVPAAGGVLRVGLRLGARHE